MQEGEDQGRDTREEVILSLEAFGAQKLTENTWGFAGHVFRVYQREDQKWDLDEL